MNHKMNEKKRIVINIINIDYNTESDEEFTRRIVARTIQRIGFQ